MSEEEKDDIENEIVPKVKHKSGVGMAIVFVILSGIVFGAIGYWYGTSTKTKCSEVLPVVSSSTTPAAKIVSKTPTISKTPSVVSTTASPTVTASATVTATTSVGITQITN